MKMYTDIYYDDWQTAQVQKETDNYLRSLRENILCKEEIETILAQNFDGRTLKAGTENLLIEKFGVFRVAYVLAANIQQCMFDGRFSRDNKSWAQTIPVAADQNLDKLRLTTHFAVLNGFADSIQTLFKEYKKSENKSFDRIRLMQGRIQYDSDHSYLLCCTLFEKEGRQFIKAKAIMRDILNARCHHTIQTTVIKGMLCIPVSVQENDDGTFSLQVMQDCLLPEKENAGYKILLEARQPEHTVVLGQSQTDVSSYVTWREKDGETYFWGRYFSDKQCAYLNFMERVKEGSELKKSQDRSR